MLVDNEMWYLARKINEAVIAPSSLLGEKFAQPLQFLSMYIV